MGRQRDSWNLVLTLATPTLGSHWLVLWAVGLGLRAQCPGSSRACHSATPRLSLVLWAQGSRRLQTTQRACPGLDLPSQSSVQPWALVLSTSSQVPSYSPSDPSRLGPYPQVQKLRALFDMG